LFGIIASFHGLILASGRSTFEFGKVGAAPRLLGIVNKKTKTPANALLFNMAIGIITLITGHTGEIITLSVFGAITLYIFSMASVIKLRRSEPGLDRPFKVPLYPLFPLTALIIASISFIAMMVYNPVLGISYLLLLAASLAAYRAHIAWNARRSITPEQNPKA
jgi:ethanolamine permease